jgi:hypothetical protein
MKSDEILTMAIRKAIENGWDVWFNKDNIKWKVEEGAVVVEGLQETIMIPYIAILFSQSFGKAFWGDGYGNYFQAILDKKGEEETREWIWDWQYHMQQMIIQDDRVAYLEQFVKEKGD